MAALLSEFKSGSLDPVYLIGLRTLIFKSTLPLDVSGLSVWPYLVSFIGSFNGDAKEFKEFFLLRI